MPLTQDSFRDPRKLYPVRAKSGFFMEGRKAVEAGEILQLPRSVASELVHSGKADRLSAAEHAALTAPTPPAAPEPAGKIVKEK